MKPSIPIILSLLVVLALVQMGFARKNSSELSTQAVAKMPARVFPRVTLEARAAFVYDPLAEQVLLAQNAHIPIPLASLTKIMTAVVAIEKYDQNSKNQTRKVFADASGRYTWTLPAFLERMLIASSNHAALVVTALAGDTREEGKRAGEHEFVAAMNSTAARLNLPDTRYLNTTGLDIDTVTAGAYGTASETARLLWYAVRTQPDIFRGTSRATADLETREGVLTTIENTNTIVDNLPAVIASKTGFTELAGGNLAIVADMGFEHPVVLVVMGSSEAGRFEDMQTLVRATLDYFASDLVATTPLDTVAQTR